MQNYEKYDVIVVGAGAAGMTAAIVAARGGKKVLLLEKLSSVGAKLKATGGGRCNLSNTLPLAEFIDRFGKNGRFMRDALNLFGALDLMAFFEEIGVPCHVPDGFRIFPNTHSSTTVVSALQNELLRLGVALKCDARVDALVVREGVVNWSKRGWGCCFCV